MGNIIHPFNGKQVKLSTQFCGRELSIATGHMAFQADGAVTVRYGDTVILGTAVVSKKPRDDADFFPLMVDYEEKMYAAGKISGSRFIKREARPTDQAILSARLIDRPIRPLFPKGYRNEVHLITTVLSVDQEHSPDIVAMIAASTALMITGAPFAGPIGGVRVGLLDGQLVPYPTIQQMKDSQLDLVVSGTKDAVMMVEAGANEVDDETVVKAIELGHQAIQPVIELQQQLCAELAIEPMEYTVHKVDEQLELQIEEFLDGRLGEAVRHENRYERHTELRNLEAEVMTHFASNHPDQYEEAHVSEAFEEAIKREVRRAILEENARPDRRAPDEIRPLSMKVGVLPRTHGSSIFTRGATQALNVVTLAPPSYGQMIDTMEEDTTKHYLHHYNFPPFSVGEARPLRGPGRREIGHGALAQRAVEPMIPPVEEFPYTIRAVSEILSSSGSTSMAAVCSTTLALMDAGVPMYRPVSGIAMGLISRDDQAVILSDIVDAEDFAGDMDFKVAGTEKGITALQMDIKIKGISPTLMAQALQQANAGRAHILSAMLEVIAEPRAELSPYAPRITKLQINPDKIREVIGKGGETINKIIAQTGVEIDIQDGGLVLISSADATASEQAVQIIKGITDDPEVGATYDGTVVNILDFGAFVEFMPGKEGMVHVSEIKDERVENIHDVLKVGDKVRVKLMEVDDRGRNNLSIRKADK